MSKIRLLLAIFVASLCSVQLLSARTAPTLPAAKTLESGKTYYLYNVGSDRFLYYSPSYSEAYLRPAIGSEVKISAVNGTPYTLMSVNGEKYLNFDYYSGRTSTSTSLYGNEGRFTIKAASDGYTIQGYQAADTMFLGYKEGSDNLRGDVSRNNTVWQLFDATEAAKYIAKRNLYRALESADGYEVSAYETIYEDEASSNYTLQEAADKLNKAVDASKKVTFPSWSDYKVLVETNLPIHGAIMMAVPIRAHTSRMQQPL